VSDAIKILVGILTVVSVTIGIILGVRQLLPDPEPPRLSVVILVDTSRAMREQFEAGKTKFEAVRAQILEFARRRPDAAIAIRFSGGICSTDYDEPAIAFERDNITEIKAALEGVQIRGLADFAFGIGEAVNDFDHYKDGRSAESKSIWAFLGSAVDTCRDNAFRAIRDALREFDSDSVKFDFFGVGASETEADRLQGLVARLDRAGYQAHVATPKSISELRESVENTSLRETPSE
jgi:von Willebrand factor type A domain